MSSAQGLAPPALGFGVYISLSLTSVLRQESSSWEMMVWMRSFPATSMEMQLFSSLWSGTDGQKQL